MEHTARASISLAHRAGAESDELNATLAVANAEADRALAEERQRADRLNEQVQAQVKRGGEVAAIKSHFRHRETLGTPPHFYLPM